MYIILFSLWLLPLFRIRKRSDEKPYMSRDNTQVFINGWQSLIVMVTHWFCTSHNVLGESVLIKSILIAGFLAVAEFFFESGYGVMARLQENSGYLKHFLTKRVLKTYGMFAFFNVIVIIICWIQNHMYDKKIIIHSFINPLGGFISVAWFLMVLIVYYIAFYVVALIAHYVFHNTNITWMLFLLIWIILLFLKFGMHMQINEMYLNHGGAFLLGLLVGTYKSKIEKLLRNQWMYYILLITQIMLFGYCYVYMVFRNDFGAIYNYFCPIIISFITLLIFYKVDFSNNDILKCIAKYSVPIYYFHMTILSLVFTIFPELRSGQGKVLLFPVYVGGTFVFAFLVDKLLNSVSRVIVPLLKGRK